MKLRVGIPALSAGTSDPSNREPAEAISVGPPSFATMRMRSWPVISSSPSPLFSHFLRFRRDGDRFAADSSLQCHGPSDRGMDNPADARNPRRPASISVCLSRPRCDLFGLTQLGEPLRIGHPHFSLHWFSEPPEFDPICLILLVGAGRFERPTPCAQGRCATRLRYAPYFQKITDILPATTWAEAGV